MILEWLTFLDHQLQKRMEMERRKSRPGFFLVRVFGTGAKEEKRGLKGRGAKAADHRGCGMTCGVITRTCFSARVRRGICVYMWRHVCAHSASRTAAVVVAAILMALLAVWCIWPHFNRLAFSCHWTVDRVSSVSGASPCTLTHSRVC